MKILLSAYYCDPEGVSEYYVGFRFWKLLSEKHDVHLITDLFKKPRWQKYLADKPELMKKVHFVDLRNVYKVVPKLFNIPYYAYNIKAWFLARELMKVHDFDIIHHVTASMFRFPVFLSGLGIPFVWGPIGGAVPEPEGFSDLFGGDRFDRRFRRFDSLIARYDPMIHSTMANASKILVATGHFYNLFPERFHGKMKKFKLCGFDVPEEAEAQTTDDFTSDEKNKALELLFVGRIVPYKGLQFLLDAMARLKGRYRLHLSVAGSGPYLDNCKELTKTIGLTDNVTYCGRMPHHEVMTLMEKSDIYVIPSLRESWGISPMEAMSRSIPVIGIDNGGLSEVLDAKSAILVKPQSSEQVITDLTSAIEKLVTDPALRTQMGRAGRERVGTEFSWSKIGSELEDIYQSVVDNTVTVSHDSRDLVAEH